MKIYVVLEKGETKVEADNLRKAILEEKPLHPVTYLVTTDQFLVETILSQTAPKVLSGAFGGKIPPFRDG